MVLVVPLEATKQKGTDSKKTHPVWDSWFGNPTKTQPPTTGLLFHNTPLSVHALRLEMVPVKPFGLMSTWVCLFEGTLIGVALKGNQKEHQSHLEGFPLQKDTPTLWKPGLFLVGESLE